MLVPIIKHLDDLIHMPPGVRDIIMSNIELVLVGWVVLEHAVPAVIGVACNHIELGLALVQINLFRRVCSVFGSVSVRTRFFELNSPAACVDFQYTPSTRNEE